MDISVQCLWEKKITDILFSPDDHIILHADDFQGFIPKQLLVRTVTVDKTESSNSDTIKLPHTLIQEITNGAAKNITKDTPVKQTAQVVQQFHIDKLKVSAA